MTHAAQRVNVRGWCGIKFGLLVPFYRSYMICICDLNTTYPNSE